MVNRIAVGHTAKSRRPPGCVTAAISAYGRVSLSSSRRHGRVGKEPVDVSRSRSTDWEARDELRTLDELLEEIDFVLFQLRVSSRLADDHSIANGSLVAQENRVARIALLAAKRRLVGAYNQIAGVLEFNGKEDGVVSSPATVDYTSVDGTAKQKGDYIYATGRLVFAAGETQKTFAVLINEDNDLNRDKGGNWDGKLLLQAG